jgi:hypothetical protein
MNGQAHAQELLKRHERLELLGKRLQELLEKQQAARGELIGKIEVAARELDAAIESAATYLEEAEDELPEDEDKSEEQVELSERYYALSAPDVTFDPDDEEEPYYVSDGIDEMVELLRDFG